jgi:hypothetical protein
MPGKPVVAAVESVAKETIAQNSARALAVATLAGCEFDIPCNLRRFKQFTTVNLAVNNREPHHNQGGAFDKRHINRRNRLCPVDSSSLCSG